MSSQSNLALCANLSDLVKKVILAFCEVNVSFTHRLDIYGSVHVRSDDTDVTSFLLNEHCRKKINRDESSDTEEIIIRQKSRSDGSHRNLKVDGRSHPESSSLNERIHFDENTSDEQLRTAHGSRGDNIDSSTSINRSVGARDSPSVDDRLCAGPELNGVLSEEEEKTQPDKMRHSLKHSSERSTTSDTDREEPAGDVSVTESNEGTKRKLYDPNNWNLSMRHSPREISENTQNKFKTKGVNKKIKLEATGNAQTQVKSEPLSSVNDVIDLAYDDEDNIIDREELDYNSGYDAAAGEGAEAIENDQNEYENNGEYQNNQGYSPSEMYSQQLPWVHSSSGGGRQGAAQHDGGGSSAKGQRYSSTSNTCGYCMKNCFSSLQLRLHIERHHNGGLLSSKTDDAEYSESSMQVSTAGYFPHSSSSASSSQAPLGDGMCPERLVCSMCDLSFKSLDGLRCHENSKHSMNKVYRCQFCSQAFLTRQAAYTHRIRFHRVKPKLGLSTG